MIDSALQFLETFLNEELKRSLSITDDPVIASGLVNPDGSVVNAAQNKVVLSIINVEEETFMKSQPYYKTTKGDTSLKAPMGLLNLYILASCNQNNYMEALKMLSEVIGTFHIHSFFTSENAPDLPTSISKLTLEKYDIPVTEIGKIWSGIGAKYVPSILYKVRMIAVQENQLRKEVPTLTGLDNNVKGQ